MMAMIILDQLYKCFYAVQLPFEFINIKTVPVIMRVPVVGIRF